MLGTRGLPQSSILSVSAGGMRKQVQVSAIDGPLRFSAKANEISQIRIDVMDTLGRARLPYQPTEQQYTLPLEALSTAPANVSPNMELDVVVRPVGLDSPANPKVEESHQRRETDANGYLEEQGLVNFMQFLLHSLMQDKPADPYPFIQRQVAMQVAAKSGNSIPPSPSNYPAFSSGMPMLTVPTVDTSLAPEYNTLLESLTPQAASSMQKGEIMNLEREAEEARARLLADNEQLRETAMQMNLEYERLMRESSLLNEQLNAKRAAKAESQTQQAYSEIEKLQNDVKQLARENAALVSKLARGREMIDLVRQDVLQIQRDIDK